MDKLLKQLNKVGDMSDEANRLSTFSNWVFNDNDPCSAIKLAKAGFYFTGNSKSDSVTCFNCSKTLDCWEREDDPWVEHLKHEKTCQFAVNQKEQSQYTLVEFLDMRTKYMTSCLSTELKNVEAKKKLVTSKTKRGSRWL